MQILPTTERPPTCPTTKVRHIFWEMPFLLVLDHIIEAGTDFQELYTSFFPTENARSFNSRSRRYGATEEAVGAVAYELSTHLGLDIPVCRAANPPTVAAMVESRKVFKLRYLESLSMAKNVRR